MMLHLNSTRCAGCGNCIAACPFGVLRAGDNGQPIEQDGCRACGACVRACPCHALSLPQSAYQTPSQDSSGILVYLQYDGDQLLSVSLELLGAARELAKNCGETISGIVIGPEIPHDLSQLAGYGLSRVWLYSGDAYVHFRADVFSAAVCDCVRAVRPSILLFGATPEGRSIAPSVAVAFETGLTADCTTLFLDEGLLVQVRPAFGGNVMAEIVTRTARPQMVTVRPGVLPAAKKQGNTLPSIIQRSAPCESRLEILSFEPLASTTDISHAKILLAIGNAVTSKDQITYLRNCAGKMGAMLASSRALVEKNLMPLEAQIGLSGRAVAPDLLIACGISGSVQFRAGIGSAKRIIAINNDPCAPIFSAAHEYIVGDMFELLPAVAARLSL